MNGDPATGRGPEDPEDPFTGLEGLGADLEATFAELDARVSGRRPGGAGDSGGDRDDDTGPRNGRDGGNGARHSPDGHDDPGGLFGGSEGSDQLGGLGGLLDSMARMLQHEGMSGGGIGRQARGIGRAIATQNRQEPNVDPGDRVSVEQLIRVAEMHVADFTGLDPPRGRAVEIDVVTRSQWVDRTIDDYDGIFRTLAQSITSGMAADGDNPVSAMLAGVGRMLGPTMVALTIGTMAGRLAQRALGGYALPVPRPQSAPLMLVLPNVDAFGRRWSLPDDDLRLWVCLHEAVHHAVFGVGHVRARIAGLLHRYASAFDNNSQRVERLLDSVDLDMGPEMAFTRIQAALGDPEEVLEAVRSPAQEALLPELTALVAVITGYVDYAMDGIGGALITPHVQLSEAWRRHRAETSASDRFSERFLGLELDHTQYDRGAAFVRGVVERAGDEGLSRIFGDPADLPTPAEVDAPGLWLARIDLPC